ncbi:hypothetical protein SAMN02745108_01465 [Fibrobacter intestinalis]|uniref:Uncharacterized protein n=1 Tax=Fibrobacter intestinalis TaxID=28122 RepID=A0A1T4N3W6_9BACT|nr:hypothetical protein BGW94_0126 [Fibrobacter sp. NR9]SJZ73824.1 hypothetical protein SAMN02745108_01465 [Fibrobacter intestinalis]
MRHPYCFVAHVPRGDDSYPLITTTANYQFSLCVRENCPTQKILARVYVKTATKCVGCSRHPEPRRGYTTLVNLLT